MIKNDPQRKTLYRLYAVIGGIWLVLIILLIVDALTAPVSAPARGPLILDIVAFILMLASMILVLTLLKRVDKRRERAVAGDTQLLDSRQPMPDVNALSLPTTIELRLSKRYYATLFGIIAVVDVVLLPIIIVVTASAPHARPFNPAIFLILAALLVGMMAIFTIAWLILFFVLRSRMCYSVTADEEGITSIHNGKTTRINWPDARLFAVVDNRKAHRVKIYEVSNAETIVRWLAIPPHVTPLQAMWKPENSSYEEYERKDQALLSLVAAKTGLKLYDLGESVAKWYM